jgi:hypothetical protein
MGFFDRIFSKRGARRAEEEARKLERDGDLPRAIERYVAAGLGDDASRVALLRADADASPERRLALCAHAAELAVSEGAKRTALSRKGRLALDIARARKVALPSEVQRIAADLEAAEDFERAAEAYAIAGDEAGEVRSLTAAGAIDKLEERLRKSETDTRKSRAQVDAIARVKDLEACAERREALRVARSFLLEREDDRMRELLRDIERRVLAAPVCWLGRGRGPLTRHALGERVTIGRGDATIVVSARAASRRHLELRRSGPGVEVEDLGTRNGTTLAGARLSGPLLLREAGALLSIGNEVPCRVELRRDEDGALVTVAIDIAGETHEAPLGPLRWRAGWAIDVEVAGTATFVVLSSSPEHPAFRGSLQLAPRVELAAGDEIAETRGGPACLVVGAGTAEPDA